MNRPGLSALLLSVLCIGLPAPGAEPIPSGQVEKVVVTAHRDEVPMEEVGSSVSVITAEDLERSGKVLVLDALRSVPAVDVARNGGPGGTASVFLRGASPEHTLVLVDGVEVNDPISPSRSFDFGNLQVQNIDRIEILRGPQSTLYGSDALGGVIHIITKRGGGEPSGTLATGAGSFSTQRSTASARGGGESRWYSVSVSHLDTEGISAADEEDGNGERDGTRNTALSARLGIRATRALDLNLVVTGSRVETDLDNFGGAFGDDPNSFGKTRQFTVLGRGDLDLRGGGWRQTFGASLTDYHRRFDNPADPDHPSELSRSSYDSRLLKVEWQNRFVAGRRHHLALGVESEKEEGESSFFSDGTFGPYSDTFLRRTARTTGWFLQDRWSAGEAAALTLGGRVDDHERFGTRATYRAAFSVRAGSSGTRLRGSYGTGFKAPSLFQLYSSFGNEDLAPEESTGWDAGVEQRLDGDRLVLSASWFRNDFDDLIQFDSGTFSYANISRARTRGIELAASSRPADRLNLALGATWTDTEDRDTGEELLRRPGIKFSLDAHFQINVELGLNLELVRVGERDDLDFGVFPAARVVLPGYTLVNLAAGWQVSPGIRLQARLENALDEDYQEVLGYGAPGRGVYAGLEWRM